MLHELFWTHFFGRSYHSNSTNIHLDAALSCHDSKCQMFSYLSVCPWLANVVNGNDNIFFVDES